MYLLTLAMRNRYITPFNQFFKDDYVKLVLEQGHQQSSALYSHPRLQQTRGTGSISNTQQPGASQSETRKKFICVNCLVKAKHEPRSCTSHITVTLII